MEHIIVLALGTGNLLSGFTDVTAQFNSGMKVRGSLPPAPGLLKLYRNWQLLYYILANDPRRASIARRGIIEIEPEGITNLSDATFWETSQQLAEEFNQWLKSLSFQSIEIQLRTQHHPAEPLVIIVETDELEIWQLPWHLWDYLQDYHQAEVTFCTGEYPLPPAPTPVDGAVKILAILGNNQGIDLTPDQNMLNQLPNSQICWLNQPTRAEINDRLFEKAWDILFFAGHSATNYQECQGLLYINNHEEKNYLTISELKDALRKAMSRGLKLAIFNSCEGLGLVQELAREKIPLPLMIVMKEPVSDPVAQTLLKYFLRAFAYGESCYTALRQAREQLKGFGEKCPGADWVPVICQHPHIIPFKWPEGVKESVPVKKSVPELSLHFREIFRVTLLILLGLVATYFIMGPRLAEELQAWGYNAETNRREINRAWKAYSLARVLDFNNYKAPYQMAWICDEQWHDVDCAIKYHQKAALLNFAPAYAELSRLLILRYQAKANREDFQKAMKVTEQGLFLIEKELLLSDTDNLKIPRLKTKISLLKNKSWLLFTDQQYDRSQQYIESALEIANVHEIYSNPMCYCLLAQILEKQGKTQDSLVAWRQFYQSQPSDIVPEEYDCSILAVTN